MLSMPYISVNKQFECNRAARGCGQTLYFWIPVPVGLGRRRVQQLQRADCTDSLTTAAAIIIHI
jgi:hypothetical protein